MEEVEANARAAPHDPAIATSHSRSLWRRVTPTYSQRRSHKRYHRRDTTQDPNLPTTLKPRSL